MIHQRIDFPDQMFYINHSPISNIFFYPCQTNTSCIPYKTRILPGKYFIECWGAQGGTGLKDGTYLYEGGKGAYTSGILTLNSSTILYFYIGGMGAKSSTTPNTNAPGGWNGGGNGGADQDNDCSGGGGGATDIRLVDGDWNSNFGLINRIMVAAGGSGSVYEAYGAGGGTLSGLKMNGNGDPASVDTSTTTTQTTGNAFGQGGNGKPSTYVPSSGGGGGFYGGTAAATRDSLYYLVISNSGSSYISGHSGCNAVTNTSDYSIVHSGSSNHFSGNIFINTSMISGINVQPSPYPYRYQIGNSGGGAVRITYIYDFFPEYSCLSSMTFISYHLMMVMALLIFSITQE